MLNAAYVDTGDFALVRSVEGGCRGQRILLRYYVLAANPDQRPINIDWTVIAHWALAGFPADAVFHLGPFVRVTVTGGKTDG